MSTRRHMTGLLFEKGMDLAFSSRAAFRVHRNATESPQYGVSLRKDLETCRYGTGSDLWVMSASWDPEACRGWEVIDVDTEEPTGTSVGYRLALDEAGDQYWWSGGAWVAAAAGEWNTLVQLQAGFPSWQSPVAGETPTDTRVRLVVNLNANSDGDETPTVYRAVVVWKLPIDFDAVDDLLFDTIVPTLEAINIYVDWASGTTADGTNTFTLPSTGPYVVSGVVAVFDHTGDPDHRTNLYSAFDSVTREVTMTGAVVADRKLWVTFTYTVRVYTAIHRDVGQVEPPCLVIEDIQGIGRYTNPRKDRARTGSGAAAIIMQMPAQSDFRVRCQVMGTRVRDPAKIAAALRQSFVATPYLRSSALDVRYDLRYSDRYTGPSGSVLSELAEATLLFDVLHVPQTEREPYDGYVVTETPEIDVYPEV